MHEKKQFIFGIHAVESLLKNHPQSILRLGILEARDDKKIKMITQLAKEQKIKVEFLSRAELDQLSHEKNHQGVIAFCQNQISYTENDLEKIIQSYDKPFLLILDGIQDPHNLGACLRSADAAGVNAVIIPKDNAVGMTPTVAKVASGASETIPLIPVTNLARTLRWLQDRGIWIYGAVEDAPNNLYETDLKGSIAIVLGAEGTGLRRLTREHCDVLVRIPMFGTVSSLNVSVAAGVFLFEGVRQRLSI